MIKIKDGVYWVGSNDKDVRTIDVIIHVENGTSYNSYIVKGHDKIALIDTVKEPFVDQFIKNIEEIAALEDIDYVIVNHTELDHSGGLKKILERSDAEVVASKSASPFIKQILPDIVPIFVGEGDILSLGDKTLEFIHAPFLHWPDTMFTYLKEDHILFSCDFLGSHFCNENIFNDESMDFSYSFQHYYNSIMRPFKQHIIKAIDKIEKKQIDIVAPSHGPILRNDPYSYIKKYKEWSLPRRKELKKAVIFYASAYGGTEKIAKNIGNALKDNGTKVEIFDLQGIEINDNIVSIVEECDALIIGSSTINGDALKPVWNLLSSLTTIDVKNKLGFAFGTYAWSGEAPRLIENRMKDLKMFVPEPYYRVHMVPDKEDLKKSYEIGVILSNHINKQSPT
ncbi:MAG: FprA family A-type flavoprotein [Thermoplasmata archaeon]